MLELPVDDLGTLDYAAAYARQCEVHGQILADRISQSNPPGRLLLVEHPPVITVSNRPGAEQHLLADATLLDRMGVAVARTDRGGDITYHGPGQLVAYPILDLNRLNLRLHDYLRLLEDTVIALLSTLDISAHRDPSATGVWVANPNCTSETNFETPSQREGVGGGLRGDRRVLPFLSETSKICAIGVRVRQWVTLHGLALNVTTNLDHFNLIVPCGLVGRAVTSIERIRAAQVPPRPCPPMSDVKSLLAGALARKLSDHVESKSGHSA